MSRNSRKRIVGKTAENTAEQERQEQVAFWRRLAKRDWWAQKRGQIPASEVLPLCSHERRERERVRREYLALDPFEHREE